MTTMEIFKEMKILEKQLRTLREEYEKKVKELLMGRYPYLYFYISPTGNISVWVRRNGKDGTGIAIPSTNIYTFDEDYFDKLNQKIKPASLEPEKYFVCTKCGEVKSISEYEASVMAADYCKNCAEKPSIKALIIESKKEGFYD